MHEIISNFGFNIYVSLSILKILRKSETWSPEPVRFSMEHAIYITNKFNLVRDIHDTER